MSAEMEVDPFVKFDLLLEIVRRMETDIRELRAELRGVRGGVEENATRLARVEGRVEEQSKFLQLVLAGKQPRRTAAG